MANTKVPPALQWGKQIDGKFIAWCSHGDKLIVVEEPVKSEADFVLKAEKVFHQHRFEKHSDWI
jgi:hypothetical protein